MGSGKTTVACLLAKKLNRKLVSIDDLIVQQEQSPITDIFAAKGEKYFRALESEIVAQLTYEESLVIDCGGGIVLQDENIKNLKKNGVLVYLKANADVLHERTRRSTQRPLLRVNDPKAKIKELLFEREPFYAKADYTIDTSTKTVDEVAKEIIHLIAHA